LVYGFRPDWLHHFRVWEEVLVAVHLELWIVDPGHENLHPTVGHLLPHFPSVQTIKPLTVLVQVLIGFFLQIRHVIVILSVEYLQFYLK
jgi:hypothetical protein